jgi:hypothetical protein
MWTNLRKDDVTMATTGVQCDILLDVQTSRGDAKSADGSKEGRDQWVECPCCLAKWNQSARSSTATVKIATTELVPAQQRNSEALLTIDERVPTTGTRSERVNEKHGEVDATTEKESNGPQQKDSAVNTGSSLTQVVEARKDAHGDDVEPGLTATARLAQPEGKAHRSERASDGVMDVSPEATTPSGSCLLDVSVLSVDSPRSRVSDALEGGTEPDSGYFGDEEISGVERKRSALKRKPAAVEDDPSVGTTGLESVAGKLKKNDLGAADDVMRGKEVGTLVCDSETKRQVEKAEVSSAVGDSPATATEKLASLPQVPGQVSGDASRDAASGAEESKAGCFVSCPQNSTRGEEKVGVDRGEVSDPATFYVCQVCCTLVSLAFGREDVLRAIPHYPQMLNIIKMEI